MLRKRAAKIMPGIFMDKHVQKFHSPLLTILETGSHIRTLARLIKRVIKDRKEFVACIMYKSKTWTAQYL